MFHGDYPITRWSDDWVAPITKQQFSKYNPIKHSIFSCSHCSCSIFLLVSYSLDTQVVLSLILIDVQYSQKAVSSFEKGLHCQNHSSSGSQHPVKKIPPPPSVKFLIPPHWVDTPPPPLTTIWKTLYIYHTSR